jgi:pimeloyl-ACP methyl ester carboxylesterase
VDVDNAKACLVQPEHLAATLGYYRATIGEGYRDPQLEEAQAVLQSESPTQPLLYLHGSTDGCIGAEVAADAATRAPENARVEIVQGAGHFMQLEQPAVVNELIVNWVTGSSH